jgi:hypothetical protein
MTPDALKVALLTCAEAGPDCSKATFAQPDGMKVALLQREAARQPGLRFRKATFRALQDSNVAFLNLRGRR